MEVPGYLVPRPLTPPSPGRVKVDVLAAVLMWYLGSKACRGIFADVEMSPEHHVERAGLKKGSVARPELCVLCVSALQLKYSLILKISE